MIPEEVGINGVGDIQGPRSIGSGRDDCTMICPCTREKVWRSCYAYGRDLAAKLGDGVKVVVSVADLVNVWRPIVNQQ